MPFHAEIRRPHGYMGLEGCGTELVYIWFGAPSPSPPPASRFLTLVPRLFPGSSPALGRGGGVSRTRSRGICDCTGAPRASPGAVEPFSRDLRLSGGVSSRDLRLHGFPRVSWRSGSRGICDCPGGLLEGFATVRVSPRPPGELLEAWFSRDLRLHGAPGRSPGEPPGELLEACSSRHLRLSGAPGRPPGELLEAGASRESPGRSREKRLSVKTWRLLIRVRES